MSYGRQSNVVLVFDPTGRVLSLRRGPTDPWKPGYWNFPGGCREKRDKSAQEGAARELREESGIHIDPRHLNWAFSFRKFPGLVNVFWVKLPHRPRVSHPDREHDAHQWSWLWEIPQPAIHQIQYIVEQVTGKTWNLAPVGSTPSDLGSLYGTTRTGETLSGGRSMSARWNKSDYLAYWPKYQPFPYALKRGRRPVPNVNSVDWPQAQFAPMYLPPGSPSFQPYSYRKNDVPLTAQELHYTVTNYGPYRQSGVGRGGDLARLPLGYGAAMRNPRRLCPPYTPQQGSVQFSTGDRDYEASSYFPPQTGINTVLPSGDHASRGLGKAKLRKVGRLIRHLKAKSRRTGKQKRQLAQLMFLRRALRAELGIASPGKSAAKHRRSKAKAVARGRFRTARERRGRKRTRNKVKDLVTQQALAVEAAGVASAPSLALPMTVTQYGLKAPVVRQGWISTATTIASGIPSTTPAAPPPSNMSLPTTSLTTGLDFGDGFAYELAPLQAAAPYYGGYGGLALENPWWKPKKKKAKRKKKKYRGEKHDLLSRTYGLAGRKARRVRSAKKLHRGDISPQKHVALLKKQLYALLTKKPFFGFGKKKIVTERSLSASKRKRYASFVSQLRGLGYTLQRARKGRLPKLKRAAEARARGATLEDRDVHGRPADLTYIGPKVDLRSDARARIAAQRQEYSRWGIDVSRPSAAAVRTYIGPKMAAVRDVHGRPADRDVHGRPEERAVHGRPEDEPLTVHASDLWGNLGGLEYESEPLGGLEYESRDNGCGCDGEARRNISIPTSDAGIGGAALLTMAVFTGVALYMVKPEVFIA